MKIFKKAFSLIELIIATTVLVIWVFGISALLTNNQNNINNISEFSKKESLYYSALECFKSNKGFSYFSSWNLFYINFWNHLKWCNVWNISTEVNINWNSYVIKARVIEKNSNFAKIKISVLWWLKTKNKIFEIVK